MWSRSSHRRRRTARRSDLMFADWANRGLNLWTVKQASTTRHLARRRMLDATQTDPLEEAVAAALTISLTACHAATIAPAEQVAVWSSESVLLQPSDHARDHTVADA